MSNIAIKVADLSKSYLVGHNAARAERYTALRDVIARHARDLACQTGGLIQGPPIVQGDALKACEAPAGWRLAPASHRPGAERAAVPPADHCP